jgi:CDP-diacylglycerol--glycerol-3-phosphate 3-phosphatidyltransferase
VNLPNKLSLIRVMCIPAIVVLLYLPEDGCRIAAGILFILASVTDWLDGHIARKNNLVTDFGKFIDPVADKLLVLTTLIMLLHRRQMEAWIIIIILSRELAVDGLRMVAVGQGKVIAASWFGKIKTTCQMILIIACILLNLHVFATWYMIVMTIVTVLMTLFSAIDYFMKNRSVFSSM